MKRAVTVLFGFLFLIFPSGARAQGGTGFPSGVWQEEGRDEDNPRATTSLGMPLNAPLSPTAQHVSWGLGVSTGAGYNFNRRHALIGEFMWNWLYPTNQSLRPIQIALNTNQVNGFAFTGGYKMEVRGRTLGTYFIAGGGWYYRTASLSRPLPAGTSIGCTPAWVWWGYNCSSGTIVSDVTEVHSNSSAPGANGGVGLTFRVADAPYRMYVESRYHFAPTKDISTQFLIISWGIRY